MEENKLIVINQLPVIEEQLEAAKALIDERTSAAVQGECTEDNYKQVKALRASLNREKKELDSRYRAVMEEVTAPLKVVQTKYKECVSGYVKADAELKKRIDLVETEIKKRKEDEIRAYFEELTAKESLDWLTFEQTGVKVMMSSSKKGLRESVGNFIARVKCDISLINAQDKADEIMVEYQKSLNASRAIMDVKKRAERIEQAAMRRQAEREKAEQEQLRRAEMEQAAVHAIKVSENSKKVEIPLETPEIVKPAPEPKQADKPEQADKVIVLRLDFGRVRCTLSKAKKLKAYIEEFMKNEGGYERL